MIVGLIIVVVMALLNYQPGTFLSGWDTIHSEFNVWLDLQRTIFGVWQEYRGVGVLDGMGHTADLVRQLILLPFSLFLPTASIRYLSQFLWLGIGTLGMSWWFEKQIVKKAPPLRKHLVSSIVSTVYLLNFGTVSNFYLPLESFSVFYAFLPWCLWALFEVLEKPNRKKWLVFMGTNLLLTPAFYIPTIFIVYSLILGLTGSAYSVINKQLKIIKRLAVAALLVITLNSFWLLPFGYFMLTQSQTPREAQINQMSTQEVYLQNKFRGTWQDLVLFKGYYYDLQESQVNIMQPWIDHYQDKHLTWVAYTFAALVILGILAGGKKGSYLVLPLGLTLLALLGNEPDIENLHTTLLNASPFLGQVFRSPYTKFVSPLILFYAFYIGMAANGIMSVLEKIKLKYLSVVLFVAALAASAWLVLPVFKGNFFASSIKTDIPDEYFEMFSYFESKPSDSRIVVLPQHSSWGWQMYDWNYSGSGFIWWGLPQSTMDRAFDVWNSDNENFYWELNRALAAEDQQQFDSILKKYRVEWLVVDKNLKHFESSQNESNFEATESLLNPSTYPKQAEFDKIAVYRNMAVDSGYVRSPDSVASLGNVQKWNDWDQVYQQHGDYLYIPEQSDLGWQYTYPFASLFTNKTGIDSNVTISTEDNLVKLSTDLPKSADQANLTLEKVENPAEFFDYGQYMRLSVLVNDSLAAHVSAVNQEATTIKLNQPQTISVVIPSLDTEDRDQLIEQQLFTESDTSNCSITNGGPTQQQVESDSANKNLLLSATNNFDCKDVFLEDTDQSDGYLVTTKTNNIEGLPLLFNWIDLSTGKVINTLKLNQNDNNDDVHTFILPPLKNDQNFYQLSYTNHSYKEFVAKNEISSLKVQKLPYDYLKQLKIEREKFTELSHLEVNRSRRVLPWLYSLTYSQTETESSSTHGVIALDQAFDPGWIILPANPFASNSKIVLHTQLNNWANAWIVESSDNKPQSAYIVFLPQLLAFAGYLLVSVALAGTMLKGRGKNA